MASETDLAWAAGFIEADGCISITKRAPTGRSTAHTYQASVQVAQSQRRKIALEKLSNLFGGSLSQTKRLHWTWNLGGHRKAIRCLKAIKPYLVAKANIVDLVLDFSELPKFRGGPQPGHKVPIEDEAMRNAYYWAVRNVR